MKNAHYPSTARAKGFRAGLGAALVGIALAAGAAEPGTVKDLLAQYTAAGAGPFNTAAGERLWHQEFPTDDGRVRACTLCHNADLRQPGRHATTGKPIEPLAPSVNAQRLTDRRKIEKWFLRNCKWTLGRECTAQEKGDLLTYLAAQ